MLKLTDSELYEIEVLLDNYESSNEENSEIIGCNGCDGSCTGSCDGSCTNSCDGCEDACGRNVY